LFSPACLTVHRFCTQVCVLSRKAPLCIVCGVLTDKLLTRKAIDTSVRSSSERRRAVLRRSTLSCGSVGEGGRRSPGSQVGVAGRRYGVGRGSGVRHCGELGPALITDAAAPPPPGTHLLGDTAGAAGPLGTFLLGPTPPGSACEATSRAQGPLERAYYTIQDSHTWRRRLAVQRLCGPVLCAERMQDAL
jgi:hypothetical protein